MEQYISKSALVAEIERLKGIRKKETYLSHYALSGYLCACVDIFSFLDTLEVKEVDLEKEVDKWYNNEAPKEFENILYRDIEKFAKYFFELGLKVKDK